jgi:hypothetical protein
MGSLMIWLKEKCFFFVVSLKWFSKYDRIEYRVKKRMLIFSYIAICLEIILKAKGGRDALEKK